MTWSDLTEKLAEAQRKYASLQSELAARQDAEAMPGSNKSRAFTLRRRTSVRKAQNLKLAFSEFYLSLILLQNYQSLNFMGFKKILKKHDKVGHRPGHSSRNGLWLTG